MLEQEFKFYIENQNDLVKNYQGKYLIIKDQQIKGSFDSKTDAYFSGKENFEFGTFLIQKCEPGNMQFSQTYYTQNVTF